MDSLSLKSTGSLVLNQRLQGFEVLIGSLGGGDLLEEGLSVEALGRDEGGDSVDNMNMLL